MNRKLISLCGKNLRIGRVSIPGQIYHVTMTTQSREAVFAGFAAASVAARCLYADSITGRVQTLAYVVMPDHVHWLLQLGEQTNLPVAVRIYKAIVSAALERHIWQRGFHDHALRAEEDVAAVARYIVANPLRAGLCKRIGDYPFWNAVWL
jgi:REP element-mobilizing transposase RayT